jgi:hypothetical protein
MGEELFNIRDDNALEFNVYFETMQTLIDNARKASFSPPSSEALKVAVRLVQNSDSIDKLNIAYREFRTQQYFTDLTDALLDPATNNNKELKEACLALYKHYMTFFARSTPLSKMLKAIFKQLFKHKKKGALMRVIEGFVKEFESNLQKYYELYVGVGYKPSQLVFTLFDDIGNHIKDTQIDKGMVKQLQELISTVQKQFPHLQDKVNPIYKSISEIMQIIEESVGTDEPQPEETKQEIETKPQAGDHTDITVSNPE